MLENWLEVDTYAIVGMSYYMSLWNLLDKLLREVTAMQFKIKVNYYAVVF